MQEEMEPKYELVVDRAFKIARELAEVACARLGEQPHITRKTFNGIKLYLGVVLADNVETDIKEKPAMTEKRALATEAVRQSDDDNLASRAFAIWAAERIIVNVLPRARRLVLDQDIHQQPEIT